MRWCVGTLNPVELEAGAQRMGLTHLAITGGSDSRVDELTREIKSAGHAILDGPRRTGDGYHGPGSNVADGSFALHDNNGREVWATNTDGFPGSNPLMQNDGNLVMYVAASHAVWNTATCCH